MRINTDHNSMDMEARDTNYWLQAYMISYLLVSKNTDPVKIVIPMFPSVPHPRKPGVQIAIEWIEPDSPVAAEIAKDGANIPETVVEEVKEDEDTRSVIEPEVVPGLEVKPKDEPTTEELSPAKKALDNLKKEQPPLAEQFKAKDEAIKEASQVIKKSVEERKPKMPPGGDIGSGHPDNLGSKDAGFDRKVANYIKPDKPVDESEEKPTEIEKPKE